VVPGDERGRGPEEGGGKKIVDFAPRTVFGVGLEVRYDQRVVAPGRTCFCAKVADLFDPEVGPAGVDVVVALQARHAVPAACPHWPWNAWYDDAVKYPR
jgi:hypothetical protein